MTVHDELHFAPEGADDGAEPALTAPWKVAVVDDDESVRAITRLALGALRVDGRPIDLLEAASADEGIALFATHADIALGLIDMVMEAPDAGLRLISAVRGAQANHRTRLVVRTGQPAQLTEERVVRDFDVSDYREKTELSAQKLRTLAHSAIRAFHDIEASEHAVHAIVGLLSRVLDERIAGHLGHALGTGELAAMLASLAGLPATRVEALRHASALHDIGLIGLPEPLRAALVEADVLEGEARAALEVHPLAGGRLLERLTTPEGRLAARLAREHHERWDGAGYPHGLKAEAIALESRILAVANHIDAMLSPAPGRGPLGIDALRVELSAEAGAALDPDLAALALANLEAIAACHARTRGPVP
jgi:HD-GYP domain-containing protein (c-di-GMP phosphodiesterase class II)